MFLKRDHLIRKQILLNKRSDKYVPLNEQIINQLQKKALGQLSLQKINRRQIDYTKIQIFLLLASQQSKSKFYEKLKVDLKNIFQDQKSKKTFEDKWSSILKSNVMRLFNNIAKEEKHLKHFVKLYADTILKLFQDDKLSRIQQKFLDPFLVQMMAKSSNIQNILGRELIQPIKIAALTCQKNLLVKQIPKTLVNCQFLQYSVLSLLNMDLPHQKYISNYLIHSPNPKFLLPFRKKGTFSILTNEILLKMNKIDLIGIKYWSYFQYQDSDIYEKTRKASGWQNKGDILLQVIKSKLNEGLIKYLNLINEKAMLYNNRSITDEGINSLNSYVEMSLQMCYNKRNKSFSNYSNDFEVALEKVDIAHSFQFKNLIRDYRLKDFMLKLVELYLLLLVECSKKNLRLKFIRNIAINIFKLIENHSQEQFKSAMSQIVKRRMTQLHEDQKSQFFFSIIEYLNREWESKQQLLLNNQIAKIDSFTISFLAEINCEFELNDRGNQDLKVLKLEFFYIMALNFKENSYFESKKLLSITSIDINSSLSNNSILNILETRKSSHEMFKSHLKSLYGEYQVNKPEHQGLLAVIDQIVTYRIQAIKDNPSISQRHSFYNLIVNILEQAERLDTKMVDIILQYFQKCKKTYMIETLHMKYRDETKEETKKLITKEVCYLIEGSVSANPIIAKFCQQTLFQHIEAIPQLCFYTRPIIVLAECISVLYKKQSQQYQSKAERLKGKQLSDTILIPTDNKEVVKRLSKLMCAMYHLIIRGNCIDDVYIRVRCQHLVRENSKSQITFGWKFLKHLLSSFKEDKQFILKQILNNNSCSWFISQDYFSTRVEKLKPQKMLLDLSLIPLHEGKCDKAELKKIMLAVEPQVQTQFLIVPMKSSKIEREEIVKSLQSTCGKIQQLFIFQPTKVEEIDNEQNSLYDIISRVKMIFMTKIQQAEITNRILEVCRKYNNHQLLEYTLLKIIPFFYCVEDINQITLQIIAQTLNYLVNQLNTVTRLVLHKTPSQDDTFDVSLNCFDSLQDYEKGEDSVDYYNLFKKYISNNSKTHRFMIIKLHNHRLNSLQKMYLSILKFLNSHLHVGIAKGISLTVLTQIFSLNFELKNETLQFLSLQSIGYCLTSHLELVNVLKSSLEKGETKYDEGVVDDFYFKSLRLGLYHFQKRKTWHYLQLQTQSRNIKSMRYKIDFFIKICDYLRNQDFHKITKKKLPKRNQIFIKNQPKGNQLLHLLQEYNRPKKSETQPMLQLNSLKDSSFFHKSKIQTYSNEVYLDLPVLRYSLLYLISQQIDQAKAYSLTQLGDIKNPYSLAGKKKFINNSQIIKLYDYLGKGSSVLIYYLVKTFNNRIEDKQDILHRLKQNVSDLSDYGFPEFLDLFIERNKQNESKLKQINYWKTQNIQILFKYLTPQYQQYPYLQLYVTKVLSRLHSNQILFYLPQIYQALTLSTGKIIYSFLLDYARKSASFAHQLIWISKVEAKQQKDPHNKNPRLPGVDQNLNKLQNLSRQLIRDVIRQFTRQEKSFFREVDDFYEQVTAISGKMIPSMPSSEKKDRIKKEIQKIKMPKSIYLPINPLFKVVSINKDSGTPMQSAAKCPFLLTFNCIEYSGPDEYFENLKKNKKKQKKVQLDFEFEEIKTEQLPLKLPQLEIIKFGSGFKKNKKQLEKKNQKQQKKSMIIDPNSINIEINTNVEINKSKRRQTAYSIGRLQSINNSYLPLRRQLLTSRNNINPPTTQISCIFKVFDDIRQDCLALQVIRLFMQIFERHNLDLKLFPYKTISNRTGRQMNIGGIIQVVPKTVSRDSIGKTNEESLYQFFINNFGPQYNLNFQEARENFLRSQAAYSIISYILQIKDRHNGNILINKQEGYLVHIDFGFIFDISPANNLRFQRADFKLTEQMIKIMGGKIDSQPFQLYLNLVIKGFLLARKYHEHIVNIVKQMFRSGLPCFLQNSIINLHNRFLLDLSELEAAEQMRNIVLNAADHWTTNWYDRIQYLQQKIYH